jgi:hypothetical protein
MPIEIRELVIKATVSENQQQETPTASTAAGSSDSSTAAEQQKAEWMEQVLNILKRQQER